MTTGFEETTCVSSGQASGWHSITEIIAYHQVRHVRFRGIQVMDHATSIGMLIAVMPVAGSVTSALLTSDPFC